MGHDFGVVSRFSPMLPSRSFIILQFTLRPMIHFEVIFVKGIRSVSRFFFFFFAYGCLAQFVEKNSLIF